MELQKRRGLSSTGAARVPHCSQTAEEGSSQKFWFSGTKRFGGKEVILFGYDGKSAKGFALRHLKVASVQVNVSFFSCTTIRAGWSYQSQILQLFNPCADH